MGKANRYIYIYGLWEAKSNNFVVNRRNFVPALGFLFRGDQRRQARFSNSRISKKG